MKEAVLYKIYKELDREELIRIAIKDKKRAENSRRELEKAIRRSKNIDKENERLKEENEFLKQLIPNEKKYSYGIRMGSDKE